MLHAAISFNLPDEKTRENTSSACFLGIHGAHAVKRMNAKTDISIIFFMSNHDTINHIAESNQKEQNPKICSKEVISIMV